MMASLPLWPAYWLTAALFVGLALASLAVPKRLLMEDAPDQRGWRDIRWWSVALVAVQLGIYMLFS